MRVVLNDYSGHPFQVQLSRSLARRGHSVLHLHFADFQTPKGNLARQPGDPDGFDVRGLSLDRPFAKHQYLRRALQEVQYGRLVARTALEFQPDVVVGCNNPLDAQAELLRACTRAGVPFVFWLQDVYSIAIAGAMRRKTPLLGGLIGARYSRLEADLLRRSSAVVPIADEFVPIIRNWGIAAGRCHVVRNWAPLDDIRLCDKQNSWSRERGLGGFKVALYTGTLGLKHDPMLLVELAERLKARPDFLLVVVSEGPGASLIQTEAARRGLNNVRLLPFQDHRAYSEVLGSADVLLSIIEAEAGIFSVPSKVLSYLCAGRPIVLSAPDANQAAATLRISGAGCSVEPGRREKFCDAVCAYLDDEGKRNEHGRNGRAYAERAFDIQVITDRFERLFNEVRESSDQVTAA